MKLLLSCVIGLLACAALAYLPPVEEKQGVRVEIESFPQTLERPVGSPYNWPLGVTVVKAAETGCTTRTFPVKLVNTGKVSVTGQLDVWMNDDWTVSGPQGSLTLAPNETKTLTFTGTSKPTALHALYPVHARFTPKGASEEASIHPIAVFQFDNPKAPRALRPYSALKLGKGIYNLASGFKYTFTYRVGEKLMVGQTRMAERTWGATMLKTSLHVDGQIKYGFRTHPPWRKGAGTLWADFPLELPAEGPIAFTCENFLTDPMGQPPSDGVDYKVFVIDGDKEPQLVCAQCVTKILKWSPMQADLSAWAGKKITLRLWTGPGPKMNTCCDGGGWGEPLLVIGPQPKVLTATDRTVLAAKAVAAAQRARTAGTDAQAGQWQLVADEGIYGAGVAYGPHGLVDGALAFSDGEKQVVFAGFTARVAGTKDGRCVEPKAEIFAEKGTLRIRWSLGGVTSDEYGEPRISDLAIGSASERPMRFYAGFGNVFQDPKRLTLSANGFELSTRHIGVDYANGLSVVQAVDVVPDRAICDGDQNLCSLHAHHNATFTFVPSSKGAFAAARRFRAVAGYKVSPGHQVLGSRMCLDQWGGGYRTAAKGIEQAAKYGLTDSIFVKHVWQRWGYDYRLPEIYPPADDPSGFGVLRDACRQAGILFCPHDNYTDIYPDAAGYSYDLVVFNLDGTPQLAWFNAWRHARSYRWAPHAFHPWALRNAKLLKAGYDPDAIFIDVLTAHGPFDYLDRQGHFHSKNETSASWAKGFQMYREGFRNPQTVCVSEAGQDHLVGVADAGESDHFMPERWASPKAYGSAERTPWHDIVTHGKYVLFAGGLGGRYAERAWQQGGDTVLNGYASDDYLSNCIIGGRNPMCDGPFSRNTVKTYWLQHDACAELGRAEFLDLVYDGRNVHRQHATFSDGGEVWINRETNQVWQVPGLGVTLPSFGYYAKTKTTTSGILQKNGVRYAFAKSPTAFFVDARTPVRDENDALVSVIKGEPISANRVQVALKWNTLRTVKGYQPFVHICKTKWTEHEGIVFQGYIAKSEKLFREKGVHTAVVDFTVPPETPEGVYNIWFGAWPPQGGGARLNIGGERQDGTSRRTSAGGIKVAKTAEGRMSLTWLPPAPVEKQTARDALLGVNRDQRAVDFGGIVTDGSFRFVAGTIIPLPRSRAFKATIDLAAFNLKGRTLARVEVLEPEEEAQPPRWTQTGDTLELALDAKAFAYRLVFAPQWVLTQGTDAESAVVNGGVRSAGGGHFRLLATTHDTTLTLPMTKAEAFAAAEFPIFALRYRARSSQKAGGIFFTTDTLTKLCDQSYSQFPVIADGTWRSAVMDLRTSPKRDEWKGMVTSFRLDPLNPSIAGNEIEIARLGFFPSVEAANRFLAAVKDLPETKNALRNEKPVFAWDRSRFQIGAYSLNPRSVRTREVIRDIKRCGIDFIVGIPDADASAHALFQEEGVGLVAGGVVPSWWGGDGERAGKMKDVNPLNIYTWCLSNYDRRAAVTAVDIGDEPSALDFPYYGVVVKTLNKLRPEIPLYLNLYPNYASVAENNGKQTVNQLGTPTYREHISEYCKHVPLPYISYDFYPYMRTDTANKAFRLKMYDNFNIVAEACRKTGRDFWYIPQVNSRYEDRHMTVNTLRFQAFAAMAFGAVSITWACYTPGWWKNNVIRPDGTKNPEYARLQKVNAEIRQLATPFMRFRNTATHFVDFPATEKLDTVGIPVKKSVTCGPFADLALVDHAPLLVGEMVARKGRGTALFVLAADDMYDAYPAVHTLQFRVSGRARAFGGAGEVPLKSDSDGRTRVSLASNQALLIVAE